MRIDPRPLRRGCWAECDASWPVGRAPTGGVCRADDCNSTTVLGKAKCVLDVAQAVKSVDGAVKGIEAATTDCKSNSTQF